MKFEDLRDGTKQLQLKPCTDGRFWTTSDEEFDIGNLINIVGEYREDSRGRFLVLAFIQGINNDESGDVGCFEGVDDDLLKLRTEGFLSNIRVVHQDLQQFLPKLWVLVGKLKGKGWKDDLGVTSILRVSRAKETCTKLPICKAHLCKGLCNCGLSSSGKSI